MTPQSFPFYIHPQELDSFNNGKHWHAYRLLGAHPHETTVNNEQNPRHGFRFAVWAPNAKAVYVAGSFNHWNQTSCPLYPVGVSGIWAGFVCGHGVEKGALYKYCVTGADGIVREKADPYGNFAELRPATASILWGIEDFNWSDHTWMHNRAQGSPLSKPVSCYEIHVGSWKRRNCGWEGHPFLSWQELGPELIAHVKYLGFTHIELMPIMEHPLDQSWGYQVGDYFAPSSRFGTPEDFRAFINACHHENIGVILDWVPAHFPKDTHCLSRFDGTALYEHLDPRLGEHPDWGTLIFNYGRNEVRNFLQANAYYWLKEFHIDGLRLDAVASMIYLDYSREAGDWLPNQYGGRENLDAVTFLQTLNNQLHKDFPGILVIAEESTSWQGVSRPVSTGGLGFTFKWNMGWMHDTLDYLEYDPIYRPWHQNLLTFSIMYTFTENFVLPFSHDEVSHGKKALLSKMPGDTWQQFANLRLLYAYQWAHPGKKLLFMGGEFGQWNEWNCNGELDWCLYDFPQHKGLSLLLKDLNNLYSCEPAMHQTEHSWQGFNWLDFRDTKASVISFVRKSPDCADIIWIFNFSPIVRHNYAVPTPHHGCWQEILNTDSEYYSGSNVGNPCAIQTEGEQPHIKLVLPPLGAMAFKCVE